VCSATIVFYASAFVFLAFVSRPGGTIVPHTQTKSKSASRHRSAIVSLVEFTSKKH
jgi:hypothetical protein